MTELLYHIARAAVAAGIQLPAAESWCATYKDIFMPDEDWYMYKRLPEAGDVE
ncbi:MAG TPA: hypothetical protein VF909_14265 [Roseiflexaceae bacterium]